jgi:hypothetical protein
MALENRRDRRLVSNSIKITAFENPKDKEDRSLSIAYYNHRNELVDMITTEYDYISNSDQEKMQRFLYDGVSPTEDEEIAAIKEYERAAYRKVYNQ